jgi:hypothetical protein
VVGTLWNGRDEPPERMDADNNVKSIVSRTGIRITLDDTTGSVTLTLETPGGQLVELADGGNQVTVADANGNAVELGPAGISITTSKKLTFSAATAQFDIGQAKVNSAQWQYSGVVQSDTVISSGIVGASYTPGAGNIW